MSYPQTYSHFIAPHKGKFLIAPPLREKKDGAIERPSFLPVSAIAPVAIRRNTAQWRNRRLSNAA